MDTTVSGYWDYLQIPTLLSLQNGREEKGVVHHDEMMFIIVHQAFELWFKLVLFELRSVREFLFGRPSDTKDVVDAVHHLGRAVAVLRTATEGFSVMETMRPIDFLEFRGILSPASGFQSVQMRQLEIIMGLRDSERVNLGKCSFREAFVTGQVDKTDEFEREEALGCLKVGLYKLLNTVDLPLLERFWLDYRSKKEAELSVRHGELLAQRKTLEGLVASADPGSKGFIETLVKKELRTLDVTMREVDGQLRWLDSFFAGGTDEEDEHLLSDSGSIFSVLKREEISRARKTVLFLLTNQRSAEYAPWANLVDSFIQFEQAFLLWRNRHPRMVERQIGRRPGTGGSSGVAYLDATTQYRVYKDLWNIRAMCIARSSLTPLDQL